MSVILESLLFVMLVLACAWFLLASACLVRFYWLRWRIDRECHAIAAAQWLRERELAAVIRITERGR